MPRADFFTRFGLFVARGFFDPDLCTNIRRELHSAHERLGTIGKERTIDPRIRSARWRKACPETRLLVNSRLEELRPILARHFSLALSGLEHVQFLCYSTGDFYRAHQDVSDEKDAPTVMRDRKVSVVVFLNATAEQATPSAYGGGSLTFYGLIPDSRWQSVGFGLEGEAGLLVAFRSDLVHEVTPVTHGERYTLVSWYY